ncbi:Ribosome biogenesis regulatory protein-like protein [Hypsibius exemplaris]|uniref:Ribosome biogenesis regulatory protein n=1 Tax=Hypsibius exemplaris TaxID=2072580 RepID=A0A1W0WUD3_HYPEX|nr:Ribosome biogenesis regulatory protein-like protein [Hypsibius exemplaris]
MAAAAATAEQHGVEVDLGNLLACDPRPLTLTASDDVEALIQTEMTELAQLLLDKVWALPLERIEDAVVTTLPKPTTFLPREKPIPKAKPMTKWEKYAKEKGITKTKQSRMVWDQTTREWKPRWGYKKAATEDDDWVTEVPKDSDGRNDPFTEKAKAKKERIAKNELQRLKNVARAHKTKIPTGGILPHTEGKTSSKSQVSQAASFARTATASVGKFTEALPKEAPLTKNQGKKRKFESNLDNFQAEKSRLLGIADGITSKKPRVDEERALGRIKQRSAKPKKSDRPQREDGRGAPGGKRTSFGGGKFAGKGGKGLGKPSKGPANQKIRKPVKSSYRG